MFWTSAGIVVTFPYHYNDRTTRSTVNRQLSTAATILTDRATRPALPHERRSCVSAYSRLRSDGCDTVHCTPVAGPSHSTACGAERIHVLLIPHTTGATISWHHFTSLTVTAEKTKKTKPLLKTKPSFVYSKMWTDLTTCLIIMIIMQFCFLLM